tara:strand:+ start:451 stop:951 length:501 start_codon:yes stop_codon:yes gene_type:complete
MCKKFFITLMLLFIYACSNLNFIYSDQKSLTNPVYNKTKYEFYGKEITSMYRYAPRYFGVTEDPYYVLKINIEEEKVKKSVQKNQALIKEDYKLTFLFNLYEAEGGCLLFNKEVFSRFSYVPKSSGYNFGSDQSLEKMYELAGKEGMQQFISFVSNVGELECSNEN